MIKIVKHEDKGDTKGITIPTPFFNYTKTTTVDETGQKKTETNGYVKSVFDIIIDAAITSFVVRKGILIGKKINDHFKNKTISSDTSLDDREM